MVKFPQKNILNNSDFQNLLSKLRGEEVIKTHILKQNGKLGWGKISIIEEDINEPDPEILVTFGKFNKEIFRGKLSE